MTDAQPRGGRALAVANAGLTTVKYVNNQINGQQADKGLRVIAVLYVIDAVNSTAGRLAGYGVNVFNFINSQIDTVANVWGGVRNSLKSTCLTRLIIWLKRCNI